MEIDESALSEINKFHYLLELLKDKPKDNIMGLPHSIEVIRKQSVYCKRIMERTARSTEH